MTILQTKEVMQNLEKSKKGIWKLKTSETHKLTEPN